MVDHLMDAFLAPNIPAAIVTAALPLVAAVLSWIGLTIYRVSRNPKTTPADGVMLDLGLGFVAAAVLWFSVFLKSLF